MTDKENNEAFGQKLVGQIFNKLATSWRQEWDAGEERLNQDESWAELEPEQRHELRMPKGLTDSAKPTIEVDSMESILQTLNLVGIEPLRDRIAAMAGRYGQIIVQAARLLEPEVQEVYLSSPTLKTEADVDAWLEEVRSVLTEKLKNGPVII